MAKTYTYTQRRRVIMQITMFGILLGTIGLAALVDNKIAAGSIGELGPEQSLGDLHFRLPADWTPIPRSRRAPGAAVIVREVADDEDSERTLAVYRQHVPHGMTVQQFIDGMDLVSDIFGNGRPEVTAAKLGPVSGIRLRGRSVVRTADGFALEWDAVICGVLPDGEAVTVWLYRSAELNAGDVGLLRQVAASFRVAPAPPPVSAPTPP